MSAIIDMKIRPGRRIKTEHIFCEFEFEFRVRVKTSSKDIFSPIFRAYCLDAGLLAYKRCTSWSRKGLCETAPMHINILVGRDRGVGDREKRGREVYGWREKRGREAGFPR